jgi:hypothetical protein
MDSAAISGLDSIGLQTTVKNGASFAGESAKCDRDFSAEIGSHDAEEHCLAGASIST